MNSKYDKSIYEFLNGDETNSSYDIRYLSRQSIVDIGKNFLPSLEYWESKEKLSRW